VRRPRADHRADGRGRGHPGVGPVRKQSADPAQRDVLQGGPGQPTESVPAQLPHRADRRERVPRSDQPDRAGPVQQHAHFRAVIRVPGRAVPARPVRGRQPHTEDRSARLLRLSVRRQSGRVPLRAPVGGWSRVQRCRPAGDAPHQRQPVDRVVSHRARVTQQAPVRRATRQPLGVRLSSAAHEAVVGRKQRAV